MPAIEHVFIDNLKPCSEPQLKRYDFEVAFPVLPDGGRIHENHNINIYAASPSDAVSAYAIKVGQDVLIDHARIQVYHDKEMACFEVRWKTIPQPVLLFTGTCFESYWVKKDQDDRLAASQQSPAAS